MISARPTRNAPPQILERERGYAILLACMFFSLSSLPIWGSLLIPAALAYIVVGYNLYWTVQAIYSSLAAVTSYRRMQAWLRIDWQNRYLALHEPVQHLVVLPNFNERLEVLTATLDRLAGSAYPSAQLNVVLAMEEREEGALAKAERLRAQFAGRFGRFWITSHPLMPDETAGKGANLAYALRHAKKQCDELGWDASRVIVTTVDADTQLHPQYLAALAVQFLAAPDRTLKFFQGLLMLVNNVWDVHAPMRVLSSFWTFTFVTGVTHYQRMTTAVYSASLRLLEDAGYWDQRAVAEDGRVFFRAFFALRGSADIVPVYMPVGLDAVHATSLWRSMRIQYRQTLRWAWTVSNLPYIADQWARHPEVPLGRKIRKCLPYFEGLLILPSSWFVVTIGVLLPPLINPTVSSTVFGVPLSVLAPLILSPTLIGVVVALVINIKLRAQFAPPRKVNSMLSRFLYTAEWLLLLFSAVFYFGVPYVDAYWRLLRGRDLEYETTPKLRAAPVAGHASLS